MGVIYKLKPEIIDFILEQKKATPTISCRKLSVAIEQKFQVKVSKSSINKIFKEDGLSMPVGRRSKRKEHKEVVLAATPEEIKLLAAPEIPQELHFEGPCPAAILVKAADFLIGGSQSIIKIVENAQGRQVPFQIEMSNLNLMDELSMYLNELQEVKTIGPEIIKAISTSFQEVHYLKLNISDGSVVYLDGQFHTVWTNSNITDDFSATVYTTKNYINKIFLENSPLILHTAPGYDAPSKEFFNLLLALESPKENIKVITLYGNKSEELETISVAQGKKPAFIIGLWPWQFVGYRQIKSFTEFRPFHFAGLNKDYYIAELEIELSQPDVSQGVTLKGFALKEELSENIRLIVLSSLIGQIDNPERILDLYLNRWPNLEEGFKDFSRKIELFAYSEGSQGALPTQMLNFEDANSQDIKACFGLYLKALNIYIRWRFLPSAYRDKDLPSLKERFYELEALFDEQEGTIRIFFKPPEGFAYLKDLEYACRRLNEREITSPNKKRIWFLI